MTHLRCDLGGLRLPEFGAGWRTGLVALGVALTGAWAWPARRRRAGALNSLPIGGVLVAVAFCEAMRESGRLVPGLVVGVGALLAGGAIAERARLGLVRTAVLTLPGAWVLATHGALSEPRWALVLLGAVVVVAAPLVADLDRRGERAGIGPVLYAVSTGGVLFTVPDTDVALALMPIAVLMAVASWPRPLVRLGGGGSAAAVGVLAWASAVGGVGRLTAFVGGLACLGLLVAEPVAHAVVRRGSGIAGAGGSAWGLAVGLAQLGVVYVAARVAGVRHQLRAAVVLALLDLVGAAAVSVVVVSMRSSRPEAEGMRRR